MISCPCFRVCVSVFRAGALFCAAPKPTAGARRELMRVGGSRWAIAPHGKSVFDHTSKLEPAIVHISALFLRATFSSLAQNHRRPTIYFRWRLMKLIKKKKQITLRVMTGLRNVGWKSQRESNRTAASQKLAGKKPRNLITWHYIMTDLYARVWRLSCTKHFLIRLKRDMYVSIRFCYRLLT